MNLNTIRDVSSKKEVVSKLYVNIQGKKDFLKQKVIDKYRIKKGDITPWTKFEILMD